MVNTTLVFYRYKSYNNILMLSGNIIIVLEGDNVDRSIVENLLALIKNKGIFSEYLPSNFNLGIEGFNIYGAGATYKDLIEPYSYNMSRLNNSGDRRVIDIPEIAGFISFVNYLRDNKNILEDIIEMSHGDINSLSRIVNEEYEIIDDNLGYGNDNVVLVESIISDATTQEEETERSIYVNNMLHKISKSAGARGVLHVDISGFYKNIYTHSLTTIKIGADMAKKAFSENSDLPDYVTYVKLDERVRALNGKRTNGLLVGPYTSRILSEAILARVDIELRELDLKFIRYADDYEFYIYNFDETEKIKSLIVKVFAKYYFEVNNEKTRYEDYPFYIFTNFEKIIESIAGSTKAFNSVNIVELFNKFFKLEKDGEKGAIRYLLKSYKNGYKIENKQLYADYLLNILCNDEKALGIASKIIIDEYEHGRIMISDHFRKTIENKLLYEIEKKRDLEIIWLLFLSKYTGILLDNDIRNKLINTDNDLAKIILIHEWEEDMNQEILNECWDKSNSWILLYEMALRDADKRELFYEKLRINHNKEFYKKLFEHNFTFYKKRKPFIQEVNPISVPLEPSAFNGFDNMTELDDWPF